MWRAISTVVVILAMCSSALTAGPEWSGKGRCRILVRVEPVDIGARREDELVVQFPLDFEALLQARGITGVVDLATIQVHQYEVETGTPKKFKPFESSTSEFDRPCRFEDDAVPENFPDRLLRASLAPNGRGPSIWRKCGFALFVAENAARAGPRPRQTD